MAIQKDTEFIGKIGNLIYYKWMNLYCIRTAPTRVRQTEATRQAATNFGKVSSRSKLLRQHLDHLIAAPRDKEMQKRLKKALGASIKFADAGAGNLQNHPLMGFRFNEAFSLEHCLGFNLKVTSQKEGSFRVGIPAINHVGLISAPEGTSRLKLELQALSFSFDHKHSYTGTAAILDIPYIDANQGEMTAVLETKFERPGLVLLGAALTYWNGNIRLNSPGYSPAEVIAVST